jgi:tRNA(Arg) A34 adenosine deaminase TadA
MFQTESRNSKIFDLLFNAAQEAEIVQTSRHASCILYKKQLLSVGKNSRKTHPLSVKFNGETKPCLHSELQAIISAINQHGVEILKRCDLYNLRITNSGKIGLAKPCPGCQKAIDSFGIRRVYYTT